MVWCNKCEHGHVPDEKGMCPCTNCYNQLVVIEENVVDVAPPQVAKEAEKAKEVVVEEVISEAVTPKPKKRGRPRKKKD